MNRRSSVTVEVNGQTRTFKDGSGISFPRNMGGKRSVVAERVVFAGYGRNGQWQDWDDAALSEWAMGHGPWAMGHGQSEIGKRKSEIGAPCWLKSAV
jgi:hypothetical protein